MPAVPQTVDQVRRIDVDQYKYGFVTDIESDKAPKGLSEDIVRFISAKKNEPEWMLAWRLDADRRWLTMRGPSWARVTHPPIDYQNLYYYAAPKKKDGPKSLDEIDPEILKTYEKLGIPLREVAVLERVEQPEGEDGGNGGNGYGRVAVDAVFDSVSVATTFQEELAKAGVLFMPISEALQKHPDLVKKYLGTVVPISDNFVAKRGDCRGENSKISWTQLETGSAITWKYPSCILRGDNARGEFYSIAISNGHQQVDSGTKMLHLGKNTTSRIISKGIAAGHSNNTYRGLVMAHPRAKGARNFTNCDSLLIGDKCGAHTVPYIEAKNSSAVFEHEATTSKISEDTLFYCRQRGLSAEDAVALVVNGFVKDVLQQLPMEFAVEAQKLISISLEGSVG